MKLRQGSIVYLIANDLRLAWREFTAMFKGARGYVPVATVVGVAALLHGVAAPAVLFLSRYLASGDHVMAAGAVAGGIFTWMIAQAVFATTHALHDRADLDLLLGSPLPAFRVVAAKAMAIAVGGFLSVALLLGPVADMGAMLVSPGWLCLYPVLAGMALLATAVGFAVSLGLVELFGPRRARVYAQLTGAGLGGMFVLGAQIYAVLPSAVQHRLSPGTAAAGAPKLGLLKLLAMMPAQAALGDVASAMLIAGAGVLVFGVAIALLGERFAKAALLAAGSGAEGDRAEDGRAFRPFGPGAWRNLRLKEWRLLSRDPSLFAQLGLQIVYTIPIAVVLLRSHLVPTAFALAPTIVMIAAQVAGSIAWVTVSGEDAPELIATAPVTPSSVDRAKLGAVALPVLVILGLPLIGLAAASWRLALVALIFAVGAGASTALINFWHPMPGNRRGMLRRHSQSKLIGLVEHGLAMLWAFAVVFAMLGSFIVLGPLAAIAGVLGFANRKARRAAA